MRWSFSAQAAGCHCMRGGLGVGMVLVMLTGCGGQTGAAGQAASTPAGVGGAKVVHHRSGARRRREGVTRRKLAFSRAANGAIQTQPAAGSCHARGHGLYSRPDPRCTPGALNPRVRQSNVGQTICVTGWTATVRPPESVTEAEKRASMAAYGDTGPLSDFEYDHLVPLELGGATNARQNLWPEPGGSPNPKDTVELDLHDRVCSGEMTLARAQREIAGNWVKLARMSGRPGGGSGSGEGATCSVHAAPNSTYHDYDVYVKSNQPERPVTVTGDGHSRSWHTDAAGSADVYFPGGPAAAGRRVRVRAGRARCTGTL